MIAVLVSLLAVAEAVPSGMYLQGSTGRTVYLGSQASPLTVPVHTQRISIGKAFGRSDNDIAPIVSLEASFVNTVHNGSSYYNQLEDRSDDNFIQGDTRGHFLTMTGRGGIRYKRVGLGLRLSAGAGVMPVLMDKETYDDTVVGGTWGLGTSPNHEQLYIVGGAGPTLDVLTLRDGLSWGMDTEAQYVVGFDVAVEGTFYLRYTF